MSYLDDLQNLAKLHAQIADELDRKLESINAKPDAGAVVKNLTALSANADAAVEDAISQREAVTRYWDDRIGNLKARAAEQAAALKNAQQQQEGGQEAPPDEAPKPARKIAAKKVARPPQK
jgi:hypothetical protein